MVNNTMSERVQMILNTSPAATVVGTHIAGVNWPDIVYILTAIHLCFVVGQNVYKAFKKKS